MLPPLPSTDVLSIPPDVEGLAIWSSDFDRNSIPDGRGVYCFYDPLTGQPHYIGSGCSVHAGGSGVWRRVKQYYGGRGVCKHDARIGQIVRERQLLLKVWFTSSSGDARKYETDAILKHKPPLNKTGVLTPEAAIARDVAKQKSYVAKQRAKWLSIAYDPVTVKTCSRCKNPKKCSEYRRCRGLPFGVKQACKACDKIERAESKRRAVPFTVQVELNANS